MELRLFLLLLVLFCRGQSVMPPEHCHNLPCPGYTSKKTLIEDVEVHSLNATEWISTTIKNPTVSDLSAARKKLKEVADYVDSWPVLVNVTNGKTLALSWFVAPESAPKISDSEVRLEKGPTCFYTRSFDYFPTLDTSQEAKALCDDLRKDGETCTDDQTYFVAIYDYYISLEHYSEIWIEKKNVNCT